MEEALERPAPPNGGLDFTDIEALDEIYKGQCNVAVKAKEIGVSTEELKRLFRIYAVQRPIDEDVWRGDVELGWPWV